MMVPGLYPGPINLDQTPPRVRRWRRIGQSRADEVADAISRIERNMGVVPSVFPDTASK